MTRATIAQNSERTTFGENVIKCYERDRSISIEEILLEFVTQFHPNASPNPFHTVFRNVLSRYIYIWERELYSNLCRALPAKGHVLEKSSYCILMWFESRSFWTLKFRSFFFFCTRLSRSKIVGRDFLQILNRRNSHVYTYVRFFELQCIRIYGHKDRLGCRLRAFCNLAWINSGKTSRDLLYI